MSSAKTDRLQLIVNPASGSRLASTFLSETLIPFLQYLDLSYDMLETGSDGDGERIGKLIREQLDRDGKENQSAVVAVLGGDGTAHELVTGFNSISTRSSTSKAPSLQIIPLPLGTANALYNSLHPPSSLANLGSHPYFDSHSISQTDLWSLQSLLSYIADRQSPSSNDSRSLPHLLRLPLTQTNFYVSSSTDSEPKETFSSHIVTSFAFHANLLDQSEALRSSHPGIERFKMAAESLGPVQFSGTLNLHGSSASSSSPPSHPKLYNPLTKSFEPISDPSSLSLPGPFSYILSSTTVSRLEPTFVIAPLLETKTEEEREKVVEMDLIVLRPARGKGVKDDLALGEGGKGSWRNKVWGVLGAAYKDGKHVDLILEDSVDPGLGGYGEVECYRVTGFDWIPDPSDKLARVACADGQIHRVPEGGMARSQVLDGPTSGSSFWVWK